MGVKFDACGIKEPRVVFGSKTLASLRKKWEELEDRGGRVRHLNASDLMCPQEIFRVFSGEFSFPRWFGRNWDAMVDSLGDLCVAETGGVGVSCVIHDADALAETEHLEIFLSVLCQAADRSCVEWEVRDLAVYSLEESYVLDIQARPGRFVCEIDLALNSDHPMYSAPLSDERHCYRRGKLEFSRVVELHWSGQGTPPAKDTTGELDYGCVDFLKIDDGRYVLSGDFGVVSIVASGVSVALSE